MRKGFACFLTVCMVVSTLGGCGNSKGTYESAGSEKKVEVTETAADEKEKTSEAVVSQKNGDKKKISIWFWGAPPEHQEALNKNLVEAYNQSQDEYMIEIEYRSNVDTDISVALSAGEGPDIVYGSGPAFIKPMSEAGRFEPLDKYSEQYGWEDRLIKPLYQACTVNETLYALPLSLSTIGIFYNKKVLEKNGWEVPTTIDEVVSIMDEAMEKGMYGSVTGSKGWKPVNLAYASLFINHFAGSDVVYKCLTGQESWNNPAMVNAINTSAEWYKKGYLCSDYINLNYNEAMQLLADERAPFFFGLSIVCQFASTYFNGDTADDLGFIPFPSGNSDIPYPTYSLGGTATFSINANSKYKDECAAILDRMMNNDFMNDMTESWPGYWGIPLKDPQFDMDRMEGLSEVFCDIVMRVSNAVEQGNFGYITGVFYPSATNNVFADIDMVWNDTSTAEELLDRADKEFQVELKKGLVPPTPVPGIPE